MTGPSGVVAATRAHAPQAQAGAWSPHTRSGLPTDSWSSARESIEIVPSGFAVSVPRPRGSIVVPAALRGHHRPLVTTVRNDPDSRGGDQLCGRQGDGHQMIVGPRG